mmetsp:Transcript_8184/g.11257  ORF Transcript_8184/g.11257 Transcript_8184/m.11257 type:complete len:122 (+) Transcript_8184:3-368(+)
MENNTKIPESSSSQVHNSIVDVLEIYHQQQCPFLSESAQDSGKTIKEQKNYFNRLESSIALLQQDPHLTFIVNNILNTIQAFTSFFVRNTSSTSSFPWISNEAIDCKYLEKWILCRLLGQS